MAILDVTDINVLNTILQTPGAVILLDFHAKWCGPCKQASPYLAALADGNPGLTVVKVDIDEADAEVVQTFGVKSLPLFVVVKGGKVVKQVAGFNADSTPAALKAAILS